MFQVFQKHRSETQIKLITNFTTMNALQKSEIKKNQAVQIWNLIAAFSESVQSAIM